MYGPRGENAGFLHMRKQGRRSACGKREADRRLCSRCTDRTIPLLSESKLLSLWPSSGAVQPGLCRTWSETPKTGFLETRLMYGLLRLCPLNKPKNEYI